MINTPADKGRSSGLLHPLSPSHYKHCNSGHERAFLELTAAGTAPDFNRIPYYRRF